MDCIKIAIQNLFKLADTLPACDVCEAASIVLCFVKDSYPISSALLTEFENNDGYQLLLKILLRYVERILMGFGRMVNFIFRMHFKTRCFKI